MNDVATEAGADRASVYYYYYYKDRRELFHAVIIDTVQHLVNEAGHIAAADMTAAGKVQASRSSCTGWWQPRAVSSP